MQNDERLAGIFAAHFHVLPAELPADARAKGFGDRFLCRKTRGEERRGISMREAISDFGRAQYPVQKALAELLVGSADARHLDDVDAGAQNHIAGFTFRTIAPFRTARVSPSRF